MQNTRRDSLNVPVARTILGDIAAGVLKPGERVPETAYSERCGVSRTPVREALQFLHKQRVVKLQARLGARVAASSAQAKKLLQTRVFTQADSSTSGNGGVDPVFVDAARRVREWLANDYSTDVIKDSAIARDLGVSRTTANRALAILARQNLIEPLPRRGWKRVLLGPRQIIDLYDFRLAIEPAALESAWEQIDRKSLEPLLERTKRAATETGILKLKPADMAELDLDLHHAILQSCPNPLLRRAMEEQEALRVISVAPAWRAPVRSAETFKEHAEILEAILAGERAKAVDALRRHLTAARDDTAERVAKLAAKQESN
jgi:DNA-binding GntR family transcriptional regulator